MFKNKAYSKVNKVVNKQTFTLATTTAWLLLLCQTLNLILVSSELTLWMNSFVVIALVWRLLLINKNKLISKISKPWLVTVFALSGCLSIALVAKQLGLLVAMLHLLSFAYAIKALELKSRKDFYQLILLGLFLLATSFIFNQSLLFASVVAIILTINFSLLLQYFSPYQRVKSNLVTSGKLILQSLPLAIILFIVFPRLAPFWQVPLGKSATTGLSDQVSPGDIANLARSNELAFRVTFEDEKPNYSSLYWRALVLDSFDGRMWQQSTFSDRQSKDIINEKAFITKVTKAQANLTEPVSYQVIAQPSYQQWLFALDIAQISALEENQSAFVELADFTLRTKEVIRQAISYRVDSYMQVPLDLVLDEATRKQNLSYPKDSNPKLTDEANRLRALYQDDLSLAQAVLDNFREQTFFYTLKPPVLFENSLDQFYFDTKQGFCAHYASAFTYLMRAAGIPARMVTGYLGGEYNPNGDYYAVYQYEAHAWSEIWLEGIGWHRVDPTAAVDPSRVENGLSDELLLEQASLNDSLFNFTSYRNLALFKAIRLQFSAIDYQWTRWVIGYSARKQYDLMSRWFGQLKPWKTAAIIGLSFISMVLIIWLFARLSKRKITHHYKTPWLDLYHQLITLLAVHHIDKPLAMSASDFSQVASQKLPHLARELAAFNHCFTQLNYQQVSQKEQFMYLQKMKSILSTIKKNIRKT